MTTNLTPELQKQIEQKAKDYANLEICDWGKIQGNNQLDKWELAHETYIDAAEVYAEKWQEEKERVDRYEKALKLIEQMSDPGDYYKAICDMKAIASEALNPKPTTNDTE